MAVQTVKCMQSDHRYSFLLKVSKGEDVRYLILRGNLTPPLQSIERNTAECIVASLKLVDLDLVSPQSEMPLSFESTWHVAVQDNFSANDRAERAIFHQIPKEDQRRTALIVLLCDIHKGQTAISNVYGCVAELKKGIVAMYLALQRAGAKRQIRNSLFRLVQSRLVIYHNGSPGQEADDYRRCFFRLFFASSDRASGISADGLTFIHNYLA
jgi:hypothetical protein